MPIRNEKYFWIEMSIREITTQAHFADMAFKNITSKVSRNTDVVFSSIHSFLSHCANVSKLLKGEYKDKQPTVIYKVLGIPKKSLIHNRRFRNHLDHYDERLKKWVRKVGVNANIGTYNIGPKSMIPNIVFISHYDPNNKIFTFVNEDFDIGKMHEVLIRIKNVSDRWVSTNT